MYALTNHNQGLHVIMRIKAYPACKFLMDFCIYDDILDTIQIAGKKLLHFKLSKSGQILHVGKTGFPRPSHKFISAGSTKSLCLPYSAKF